MGLGRGDEQQVCHTRFENADTQDWKRFPASYDWPRPAEKAFGVFQGVKKADSAGHAKPCLWMGATWWFSAVFTRVGITRATKKNFWHVS
ncbi:MAG: hypothetical protein HUN04_01895 [Desulfobacter sp.]|nr:MAG: hypothetical protein HUN04_01895 [Desulfobacter sp.]